MRRKYFTIDLPILMAPDTGAGQGGGAGGQTQGTTETPASGGVNPGGEAGGAGDPPAASGATQGGNGEAGNGTPPPAAGETKPAAPQGQSGQPGQAPATKAVKPLAKPITTQEEFDAAVESRLARERKAAERSQAEAKGEWERLYKLEQTRVADVEADYKAQLEAKDAEINGLTTQIATAARNVLVAKVAAQYGLPQALADRLQGQTEAELKKDAEQLAKVAGIRAAPRTESGNAPPPRPGQGNAPPVADDNRQWAFNTPGGIKW